MSEFIFPVNTAIAADGCFETKRRLDNLTIANSFDDNILITVFSYLNPHEWIQLQRVCRKWNNLLKSPLLWCRVQYLDEIAPVRWVNWKEDELHTMRSSDSSTDYDHARRFHWQAFLSVAKFAGPYLASACVDLSDASYECRGRILRLLGRACPGIQALECRISDISITSRADRDILYGIPNFSVSLELLWLEFEDTFGETGSGGQFFSRLFPVIGLLDHLRSFHISIAPAAVLRLNVTGDETLSDAGLKLWGILAVSLGGLERLSLDIPHTSLMDGQTETQLIRTFSALNNLRVLVLLLPTSLHSFSIIMGILKVCPSLEALAILLPPVDDDLITLLKKHSCIKRLALMNSSRLTTGGIESALFGRPKSSPHISLYLRHYPIIHPTPLSLYDSSRCDLLLGTDIQSHPGAQSRPWFSSWQLVVRDLFFGDGIFRKCHG